MNGDEGIIFTIGLIIVSIGVGILATPAYGWLTLGGGIIAAVFINVLIRNIIRRE